MKKAKIEYNSTYNSFKYLLLYPLSSHYEKIFWNAKDPKYKNPPLKARLGRGNKYAGKGSIFAQRWQFDYKASIFDKPESHEKTSANQWWNKALS